MRAQTLAEVVFSALRTQESGQGLLTWRECRYIRWHLVYNLSPLLSQEFLDATLKVDANLMGISQQPERWHKCVAASKAALPMVVNKLFIEHFFSEYDRQIALTMLDYIRCSLLLHPERRPRRVGR